MRCACGRGIERWNDVVGCKSKAEYGVEDVVVDEVVRERWIDVADFVEYLQVLHAECLG